MSDYCRILAAIDFTEGTARVCERAADMARRHGARLWLLHVMEPVIVDPVYDMLPAMPVQIELEQIEQAKRQLTELGAQHGVAAEDCRVEMGATKVEIARFAEESRIDLIVMGSHGRSGVSRLLGSTTTAVLHAVRCDVLAVRAVADDESRGAVSC